MQYRRDTHGLADFCQSRTAIDLCGLRSQKACLGAGNGVTSCSKYDYIILDQFLDNCDMPRIQRGSGVVSPNHAADTPYTAINDVVIEGVIGSPKGPT